MILPYLHERKIQLNQIDPSQKFFYTVVNERSLYTKIGKPTRQSTLIFAMNLTNSYYDVFSEQGILLRNISFKHHVEAYGIPIAVSANGRNSIFQKPEDQFNVHLLCFTSEEVIYIKSINIKEAIGDYIETMRAEAVPNSKELASILHLKRTLETDFKSYFIHRNSKIQIDINDNFDVAIQISNKLELDLFTELYQTFHDKDVEILFKIAKKKSKLAEYRAVRRNTKEETKLQEEIIDLEINKLSEDAKHLYAQLDR